MYFVMGIRKGDIKGSCVVKMFVENNCKYGGKKKNKGTGW